MDLNNITILTMGDVLLLGFLVLCWLPAIRYYVVKHNRDKVEQAIFKFRANYPTHVYIPSVNDMEPFMNTYLRVWDWGCEGIVRKYVYMKISRYL